MDIKTNDTVMVLSGSYKGLTGTVEVRERKSGTVYFVTLQGQPKAREYTSLRSLRKVEPIQKAQRVQVTELTTGTTIRLHSGLGIRDYRVANIKALKNGQYRVTFAMLTGVSQVWQAEVNAQRTYTLAA